jgi:nicotinate-nucleotide pyrophosphorylase (carboxylating)
MRGIRNLTWILIAPEAFRVSEVADFQRPDTCNHQVVSQNCFSVCLKGQPSEDMCMVNGIPTEVTELIRMALKEDIGAGDLTAEYFVPNHKMAQASIIAKEPGILAGGEVAAAVFRVLDPNVNVEMSLKDGAHLQPREVVMKLEGPARSILTGERTALNFLQRLSGIATQTNRYVQVLQGTGTKILDTRKTTPGWRWLEKMAVRAGGGTNHRTGLFDMVMVKDNHLADLEDLAQLQSSIDALHIDHPEIKVELEADRIDQVKAFLGLKGVSYILLDNMTLEEMEACVTLVKAHDSNIKLEASGGITLESLRLIAETGVDFISSGALTHSVKGLDLSLDFEGTSY